MIDAPVTTSPANEVTLMIEPPFPSIIRAPIAWQVKNGARGVHGEDLVPLSFRHVGGIGADDHPGRIYENIHTGFPGPSRFHGLGQRIGLAEIARETHGLTVSAPDLVCDFVERTLRSGEDDDISSSVGHPDSDSPADSTTRTGDQHRRVFKTPGRVRLSHVYGAASEWVL